MRVHLTTGGIVWGEGTHFPIKVLRVGVPYQSGIVVYFVSLPDQTPEWIFEEWTVQESQFSIVYWRFFEDRITYHTVTSRGGHDGATQYINSRHSLWNEAIEKSKQTWKLLCGKYPCTDSFPP